MILTVTLNPCLHKIVTFRGASAGGVVIRPVESRFIGGGKGVNAARAARRLGGRVVALLSCGGQVGEILREDLAREGLEFVAVPVARPTRMSTIIHDAAGGTLREYLEGGAALTRSEEELFRSSFLSLLGRADLVSLNGSVPDPGLNGFHAWAVERCNEAGKKVIVDTYGPAAVLAAEQGPYVLKANLEEVRSSFGCEADTRSKRAEFVRPLLERSTSRVLLTGGARGAWLFSSDEQMRVIPPSVKEVNPVGSGDAMLGALLALLDAGASWTEALRMGAAAGAANAARAGVCDFEQEEVERLRKSVKVEIAGPGQPAEEMGDAHLFHGLLD
ncbi:MAG: PfkB family carbohydrate kinase [Planctomycetota bacterium]